MKICKFFTILFFNIIAFVSCTSNDDNINQELIINGSWFLIQSCNRDNEECFDVEKGNHVFDFNSSNGTVTIEKDGVIFPSSNYEIRRDRLGSWLFIRGTNWGRLITLTSESLVLRRTPISVLPSNPERRIHYYFR